VQWNNDKNDFLVEKKDGMLQIFFITRKVKHKASVAQK